MRDLSFFLGCMCPLRGRDKMASVWQTRFLSWKKLWAVTHFFYFLFVLASNCVMSGIMYRTPVIIRKTSPFRTNRTLPLCIWVHFLLSGLFFFFFLKTKEDSDIKTKKKEYLIRLIVEEGGQSNFILMRYFCIYWHTPLNIILFFVTESHWSTLRHVVGWPAAGLSTLSHYLSEGGSSTYDE